MTSFADVWREIAERPDGPLAFRFYVQPIMAILFAVRDGVRDARTGQPAYLWSLFTDAAGRRERLRHGWHSVGRIFLFAIAMDVVYQLVALRGLRPVAGVVIAALLALVPYALLRGPANRVARGLGRRRAAAH